MTQSRKHKWRGRAESGKMRGMGFTVLFKRLLFSLATCIFCAAPLAAQERLAYVIGNGADQPAKDAVAVSRALLGLGFDVIRRADVSPASLPLGNRAARTVALYFSGPTAIEDGRTRLMAADGTGWDLLDTARGFRASGADQVLVFVQTCHTDDAGVAPLPTDDMSGIFMALSASAEEGCASSNAPRFTDRVLVALATPDTPISAAFDASGGAGVAVSNLTAPLILWQSETQNITLSEDDMKVLDRLAPADRDRMRALWQSAGLMGEASSPAPQVKKVENETIVLTGRVAAVDMGAVIAPAAVAKVEPVSFTPSTGGVQIFNAAPRSEVAALPTAAGLPRPSVIVGRIQSDDPAQAATQTGGALTGTALDGSNFEARQTIRSQDAELYAELVNSGAFDPAEAQLAVALQTELKRMGCYTGGIDGDWGPGSQGSVDRYFQQIGETPVSRAATIDLFRTIALRDDVTCPRVVQARAAQPRATTRSQPRTTTRATTAARKPAPAAKKPATTGKINANALNGVFR